MIDFVRRLAGTPRNPAAAKPSVAWYRRPRENVDIHSYERTKRAFDLAFSLVLIPILLPVIGLLALVIRADSPGSPFFSQIRTGQGGRRFAMFKLRTMVSDAEALKHQYAALNSQSYPDFKITNDPRITRLGRVLRKTSLDELPQIFNVLRGDMTLVGPRPTSFCSTTYDTWHTARLESPPGITGLWQVEGRNALDFDDRVRLDIAYIRNRSLWLDLQILLRTVPSVVSTRGAY